MGLFILFLLISTGAVLVLAWQAFAQSAGFSTNLELGKWAALMVTLSLSGTLFFYWRARRPRASALAALSALVLAIITLALGLATYIPCAQGGRLFVGPLGWTLELFVGGVESDPSAGAACASTQSPGFTLARTLGLLATFAGAISAAAVLGRSQFDRRQVRKGSDVDAVIGLSPASLELVKELVDERRHATRRETWIDWRPGLLRRWQDGQEPVDANDPLLRPVDPRQPTEQPAQEASQRHSAASLLHNLTGLRRGDVRRWLTRPTRIVVVEPDEQNPLVSEARAAGAIVVNADAAETAILRAIATRRPWFGLGQRRLSLRRMFIVTDSQQANIGIHRQAVHILHDDLAPHPRDVVPRLFVRIDDHRYARRWRLDNLADSADAIVAPGEGDTRPRPLTHFSDALSHTDAVAEAIVEQFIPAVESVQWRTSEVVLIGDDPLAVQLLEELAWQQWCRYEVAYQAHRVLQDQADRLRAKWTFWVDPAVVDGWREFPLRHVDIRAGTSPETAAAHLEVLRPPQDTDDVVGLLSSEEGGVQLTGAPADVRAVLHLLAERSAGLAANLELQSENLRRASSPNLRTVVLAGPKAQERVDEWDRSRHPWSLGPEVEPPLHLIQVTAGPADWETLARDSMQSADCAVVFVEDRPEYRSAAARLAQANPEDFVMVRDDATVGLEHPIATGAPFRFGGSLTRRLSGFDASCVPVDSLARLARQQHTVYNRRWPALPAPEHQRLGRAPKITSRDWPALPDFFQEDNVRQHRELLRWFVSHGYRWITASAASRPAHEVVTRTQLEDLVYAEYDRWSALRSQRGWIPVQDPRQRDDSQRCHPDLRGRQVIDLPFNQGLMTQIMARLWATGLTVEPLVQLERQGRVKARQLEQARTWQTPEGDVLASQAGDWWVTDDANDSRGMADATFRQMHEQIVGDTWQRTGQVWARQVMHREIVNTREGTAIATPGMWIITAPTGDQWPVSDAALKRGYRVDGPDIQTGS